MLGLHDEGRRGVIACCMGLAILVLASTPSFAIGPVTYRVEEGDTPASIAATLGIPIPGLLAQVGANLRPGEDIFVNPPGDLQTSFPTKYIENDVVVKRGETLLSIAQKVQMPMEELADFNWIPRRHHLVQAGETLPAIAERYQETLKPVAEAYEMSPAAVLANWNELTEDEELPEGLLLTVGWQEPAEGSRLCRPLLVKLLEDIAEELKANDLGWNDQQNLWNPKIKYEVYVVQPGDTLQSIASAMGKKDVTAKTLANENGLDEDAALTEGQALFVPSAASLFGGALRLLKAETKKDTEIRFRPSSSVKGYPLAKGKKVYIFEKPIPNWYAVLTQEEDPKRMWAWIKGDEVEVDRSQIYYAPDVPQPKPPPQPPGKKPQPVPPTWVNIPEATSPQINNLIRIAYTYLGTPYVFGGMSKRGIDCSAFVMTCFRQAGVWPGGAPRTAMYQTSYGHPKALKVTQLQPGDRLYFDFARDARSGRRAPGVADHTGIYIGAGKFIHATPPKARIDNLAGKYSKKLLRATRDITA